MRASSSSTSRREGNDRWVPAGADRERAGDATKSNGVDGIKSGGDAGGERAHEGIAGTGRVDDGGSHRGADRRRQRAVADDCPLGTEGDDEAVGTVGRLGGQLLEVGCPAEQQLVLALVGDQPVGGGEQAVVDRRRWCRVENGDSPPPASETERLGSGGLWGLQLGEHDRDVVTFAEAAGHGGGIDANRLLQGR